MFAELIPKMVAQEQGKQSEYYPRASNSGLEKCIRASVYHGLGIEGTPFSGKSLLIFESGNWSEERVNDKIRNTVHRLHSEQMAIESLELPFIIPAHWCKHCKGEDGKDGKMIPASNKIHCHIDGIVVENGTWIERHLELKSCSDRSFIRFEQGGIPYDYISQSSVYIFGLNKLVPEITETILSFRNKNNDMLLDYRLEFNLKKDSVKVFLEADINGKRNDFLEEIENVNAKTIQRFVDIHNYIKEKKLPLRQYPIDSWRCKAIYCRWRDICYRNYKDEFEKLKVTKEAEEDIKTEVAYYLEASMHRKELEKEVKEMKKEEDKMKTKVLDMLKEKEIKKAKVGEYLLERKLSETSRLNKDLLPIELVRRATETAQSEKFMIRKFTLAEKKRGVAGLIEPTQKAILPTKTKKKVAWTKINKE